MKDNSINMEVFNRNFDWRDINKEDIKNGAGSIYGDGLIPGNYVCSVFNQCSPVVTSVCWIVTGCHIYSDTYKIAEVASNRKNIKDAEITRRSPSIQYICDYMGSPKAKYFEPYMETEKKEIKEYGSLYRGGNFHLFCKIINEIGFICDSSHNPWIAINRDFPSTNKDWYNIYQYNGKKNINNPIDLNISNYNQLESINYRDYKKDKVDIKCYFISMNDDNKIFKMQKFIFLLGPIEGSIYLKTLNFLDNSIEYNYNKYYNDVQNWKNGNIKDEQFNLLYTNSHLIDHSIIIIGWTEKNEYGRQTWIIKNSLGKLWGYYGFAEIPMGINAVQCEFESFAMFHNEFSHSN